MTKIQLKRAVARARSGVNVRRVSPDQGRKILDRQARRYLGISATTFIRYWNAGKFKHEERELAERVAVYLPFAI